MTHEHLKDRALFSLPPPPPGANPTEYYHLMASASQRSPYGDLLMQSGVAAAAAAAAAAAHLPDYITPVDGEQRNSYCVAIGFISVVSVSLSEAFESVNINLFQSQKASESDKN